MIELLRGLGGVILGTLALSASAVAQTAPDQPAPNSICVRLETQLSAIDRGGADPARAEQVKRHEDAAAKQQSDLDRVTAQSRRSGCEGIGGFFALFTGQSPQCAPLGSQIQQIRANLDRTLSELERLKSGAGDPLQRRAVIGQLAQNNCGPQYRAAAAAAGPGGFLDALFGGTIISPGGDGAPSGTYRTVCVRTCDGYYFPISYSTVPNRFTDDQRTCQRLCPASEALLYSYRNPGEDITKAVSATGQVYPDLPNAFHYRREFTAGCSCRRAGQSWADALKNADDSTTVERGDILVTDQNAKALSQAPPPKGAPGKPKTGTALPGPSTPAATDMTGSDASHSVRTVGPPFVAEH